MASGQLLVLLMCTTLVAARTVSLEKLFISLTEDSKATDPAVSEILSTLLSEHDNNSSDLGFDLQDCTKGSCKFCAKKIIDVCFIASIQSASIQVEITINGKPFLKTEISAPRTICKSIGFIPDVKQICLQFTDIDLKKMSGCVAVSIKTKLIPIHFKIGCFTIPHADAEIDAGHQQEIQNEATDSL